MKRLGNITLLGVRGCVAVSRAMGRQRADMYSGFHDHGGSDEKRSGRNRPHGLAPCARDSAPNWVGDRAGT